MPTSKINKELLDLDFKALPTKLFQPNSPQMVGELPTGLDHCSLNRTRESDRNGNLSNTKSFRTFDLLTEWFLNLVYVTITGKAR